MTSGMAVCIDSFSHSSSLFSFSILAIVFFYLGTCGLRLPGPQNWDIKIGWYTSGTWLFPMQFPRENNVYTVNRFLSSHASQRVEEKTVKCWRRLWKVDAAAAPRYMRNFLNKLFDSFHSNGKLESLENDLLYLRPERYQYWFPDSAKATSPLRPNSGNSKYYISNLYFPKFTRHADTSLKDVNLSYFLLVEGWRMVGTLASALIYFHLSTRIIIITFNWLWSVLEMPRIPVFNTSN